MEREERKKPPATRAWQGDAGGEENYRDLARMKRLPPARFTDYKCSKLI